MSLAARATRAQPWLEGLGDWAWPGSRRSVDLRPPEWVPVMPPRLEPAMAGPAVAARRAERWSARRLLVALIACLMTGWLASGPVPREAVEGVTRVIEGPPPPRAVVPAPPSAPPLLLAGFPRLALVTRSPAGSEVYHTGYWSGSLDSEGSFYAYLPPGYETGYARYPVLYLLHGRDGHAQAFLEMGIQRTLDRLIARHAIPPMIVVMVQDAPGMNNWRDIGARHSATYVVEVQQLVDRMLRTIPARDARAIAGSSMGGFGAMNVALSYPLSFSVEESWLGYFDNLHGLLQGDSALISRLGLHAFLYGAEEDPVAVPSEDPEFAAELRGAGAQASGVIYPGGHSLEKVQEHLAEGLLFAGRSLLAAQRRAAAEAAGPAVPARRN